MCRCFVDKNHNKKRKFTDPLVLSTFPHLLSLLGLLWYTDPVFDGGLPQMFSVIIVMSTLFSVLWHRLREPMGFLFGVDYGFAILWMIMELLLSTSQSASFVSLNTMIIISLNTVTFLLNQLVDSLAIFNIVSYQNGHSVWHLFSSIKCAFITSLLTLKTTDQNSNFI